MSFGLNIQRYSCYGNASLRSDVQNHLYKRVESGPLEVDFRPLVIHFRPLSVILYAPGSCFSAEELDFGPLIFYFGSGC